jgi:PAS domain S-box-containing protein
MSTSKDKKVSSDSLDNLRLFSSAVESAMDGIQIVDFDGRIMFSNKAVENIYGFTHEELKGTHVNDMNVDPDFAEKEILPSIQKKGSWIGELMVKHKDGHQFQIWLNTSLVMNNEGKPIAMVGIIRDMTDVKRAEKRIVTLIDALPDIIYFKDTESRNLVVNQAFANLTGLKKEELEGKTDKELLPPALAEHCKKQDDEVIQSRKLMRYEEEHDFHGEQVFQETIKVPLHDEKGAVTGLVGITRDITEQKKAERKLRESEERFRGAFESTGVGASMASLKGQFIKVNNALCEMLGYSEEELLAKTFSDVTHPDDVQIGLDTVKKMVSGEMTHTVFEKRYVKKDGQLINVVISPTIIRDSDGNPLHFMALFQDVTERRNAVKAIKESEERMRLLMESAQDIIVMQDMESKYTYYNANPSYGLNKEDIIGKSPQDFHDKETAKRIMDRFKRVTKSGESLSEEIQVSWQGEPLWMHEQTSPVRDSDGTIRGVVTIARNMTEMKRLEEQLRHSQKMEAIGTLTTGIAHEFFNILTAIKGSAEFLDIDISKGSPLKSYVNVIQSSVERATRLTQSLLMYSRKQLVKMETMALDEVAEHVINLISTLVIDDINVEFQCKEKGLKVTADRDQLEQVMMNLAVNSIDAMPNGGTLTINIDTEDIDSQHVDEHAGIEPGRYAIISVSDTGIGMDVKTQEKMFEPFFTTKDVGKGTGLGLSMVYGIVNKHNGYITVVSQPDRGSTFKIYLPLSSQGNIS